ncbi:MAG: hypothetical protein PVI03_01395 [Candidatus Thorarchaeota archaeon]|jgi:hypothetical protein
MGKSELSKRIDENRPIEVWESPDGTWKWEVYKKYQKPDKEAKNPYARWFCKVKSPFVPQGELGDVYVREIKQHARMVFKEKEIAKKKLKKVM